MVSNRQVKGLFKSMSEGKNLSKSAQKADMCENTARRYLNLNKLPSDLKKPRNYRTHEDVFSEIWSEITELLSNNPNLEGKTLFAYLLKRYPEKCFQESQLRTFQRKIRLWKAEFGGFKESYFPQTHYPGVFCQSDFTSMKGLNITLNGQRFDHILYHFVLTYSNWESADICFSESFESLSSGLQNALFRLGGVPEKHQTDRLSAAIKNSTSNKDFTEKYKALLSHYGIIGRKTNPSSPNENGDIEQSNNRLKKAIDQQLMLRGSRDFLNREDYNSFIQEVITGRNKARLNKSNEELPLLGDLPDKRLESYVKYSNILVNKQSTIRILDNTYSVDSRLIKERVIVLVYSEYLELWLGSKCIAKLPRLRGKNRHIINYHHIIDTLVRKPGAFENYKYKSDLFPSIHFRIAYDMLVRQSSQSANKVYLNILYFSAYNSEEYVDRALKEIIDKDEEITLELVKEIANSFSTLEQHTDPVIESTDMSAYDNLIYDEGDKS